jgi:hypothetical protein
MVRAVRGHRLDVPLRVVFLGRAVEDRKWTLTAPANRVVPVFVDHRSRDLVARISSHHPDVVVVFRPQRLASGVAAALPAATVALIAEAVHVPFSEDGSAWSSVDALSPVTGEAIALAAASFDAEEYDRVMVVDPRIGRLPTDLAVWRSPPLPVDDALYRPGAPLTRDSRALFLGESTAYREAFLVGAKHHYDLRHYAFGLAGEGLARVLGESSIGVALAPGPWTTFEAAAAVHLASGHILLSGQLDPPRGLEAGLDHLMFEEPEELLHLLFELQHRPAAFEQVRRRGRVRAEEFRASRIWPRLLRDLVLDLEAFGTDHRATG